MISVLGRPLPKKMISLFRMPLVYSVLKAITRTVTAWAVLLTNQNRYIKILQWMRLHLSPDLIYPVLPQFYQMTANKLMIHVHASNNKLSSLDHSLDHWIYGRSYSRIQCSGQHQHQHIMIWFYAVIGGHWKNTKQIK